MSRRNVHRVIVSLFWVIDTKEFAKDILAICEVLVIRLQSQLDIEIVILIIWNTESISFEHLTVAHAAIAQEHLRSFGKPVRVCADHEVEFVGELSKGLFPHLFGVVLLHFDLFINRGEFTLGTKFIVNRLLHLSFQLYRVEDLLFHEQIHIIIRFDATAIVIVIEFAAVFLFFGGWFCFQFFFVTFVARGTRIGRAFLPVAKFRAQLEFQLGTSIGLRQLFFL
jgi:hypothetical protein